jgi:hypothetical protein
MSQYRLIFTNIGLSKKQNAELNNDYIDITQFAVGSGVIANLQASMTALVAEEYRADINNVDTKNGATVFDLIIPSSVGGFYIKEVALFDVDGDCICIGTVPITYKVNQDEGASKSIHLKVSTTSTNTENIVFNTDDSLVYATVDYVNNHINNKTNPHEVTKEQLGLENVDNTADSEKNVAKAENALRLAGYTLDELKNLFFPKGLISKWSGTIATIPAGWYLCDGQNGTPDLRYKFTYGASTDAEIGTTGGSADAVVVSHGHSASSDSQGNHTHYTWTDTQGNHTHTINRAEGYSGGLGAYAGNGNSNGGTAAHNTSYAGAHAHNIGMNAAGSHAHNITVNANGESGTGKNLPPYMYLAYIMKG